jgi:ATP-dependent 26S proteasome regulatory subunit
MYLCNLMPDRTTFLLSGVGEQVLGQAAALARRLAPSMVVLEDVDLVAAERTHYAFGANPLLFQLLNEMDGLAEDVDVIFVLTTNRVELLEPALANRPGRIDEAVEIKLPDAECRRRLFELYLTGLETDIRTLNGLIAGTEGVSPAFIKELVRRATLEAATMRANGQAVVVTGDNLESALHQLTARSTSVLRATLGGTPQDVGDRAN